MKQNIKSLGTAGRALLRALERDFDIAGCEPVVIELCRTADRLSQLRVEIERLGVVDAGKLLDQEARALAQFRQLYRLAGFADPTPKQPGKIGRPSNQRAAHGVGNAARTS